MTKEAKAAYHKEYYAANREKRLAYQKQYREANEGKNLEYIKAYRKQYLKDAKENKLLIRDWLIEKYGGTPCMDCGGVFPWCSMDFDHRPGVCKEFPLGRVSYRKAAPKLIARVEKEIAKCDLVCANCHRVRTRDRHE
jgi:hypothetical protein